MVSRPAFAVLVATVLLAATSPAQCTSSWQAGDPLPTPSGLVIASQVWDADGPGGNPSVLVAGGTMNLGAGGFTGVYTYNGSIWAPLGTGVGTVVATTTWNNQLLVAAQNPGTPVTTSIRNWNGSSWQLIGTVNGTVASMVIYNNQPYIGGLFSSVDSVAASSIARWTGASWSAVGAGVTGSVRAMAVFNGLLRVGGQFSTAGGLFVGNLAYWSGATWIAGPNFNGSIDAMVVRDSPTIAANFLFVGGSFTSLTVSTPLAAARIARLDTANAWAPVGTGVPGTRCQALGVRDVGFTYEIIAGLDDPASTSDVWRFNAGVWSALGTTSTLAGYSVYSVTFYGGRWNIGRNGSPAVLSWDGTTWSGLVGQGIGGTVRAIEPRGNDVVIAGSFARAGGVTVNHVAQGASNAWLPLGTGMTGGSGVYALATASNGDLIAGGDFTMAGGVACSRVARWNGAAWAPMGGGLDGIVRALLVLPGGDVIAGGDFTATASRVARWNGVSWQPLGAGFDGPVHALARLPNGAFAAGGEFLMSGGLVVSRIAAWNGSSWTQMGAGFNEAVFALALGPDGTLTAGGRFTATGAQACRVAQWTGGLWSAVPSFSINTEVHALGVHPNGNLFVGGLVFSYTPPIGPGFSTNLMRFTSPGSASSMAVTGTIVRAIAFPNGNVAIGGSFESCAARLSVNYALYDVPCPAIASNFGAGCVGASGLLTQEALAAPWLGGALRLRTTSFGPTDLGVQALGFGTIYLPLPPVLPGALPGCVGLVTPDDLQVGNVVAGEMQFSLPIPYVPSLVGATVHAQALRIETNGGAISTSNGTALIVGVL
jgi:hypothetical protein